MALEDPVDGGSGDGEQFGEVGDGVFAGRMQLYQVGLLADGELGLFAAKLALRSGDGHAFPGTQPEQVDLDYLIAELAGPGQPYAIPAAAVLGVPLYLPTEALVPLGWGLRDAGVALGPIFAFVITAASLSGSDH